MPPKKAGYKFCIKIHHKIVREDVKTHRFALEKARYKFRRKAQVNIYGREFKPNSRNKLN